MGDILIGAAVGLSVAVVVSWLARLLLNRRKNNPEFVEKVRAVWKKLSSLFTRSVIGVLAVGLIWTVYFLVMGLADPARSEYAANIATLIVSVLTVFSIMIAFFEFLKRDKK